jgi:hypothetical protein
MAKPAPTKDLEVHPDAWGRFERAIETVAKAPPQHRVAKKPKAKKRPSKRKGASKAS